MRLIGGLSRIVLIVAVSALLSPALSLAQERSIDRVAVFGTSLSDPGNAFTVFSDPAAFGLDQSCDFDAPSNTPPYDSLDDFLVPVSSYAKGGHHFSNGATWVEQFALGTHFAGNVRPALRSAALKASNYAVGGARAADFACRYNFNDQLSAYLADFPVTSADTLIVIEIGSNDVRDALAGVTAGQDPSAVIGAALGNIQHTIQVLYGQGARKFLLVNAPNIGATPAVRMIDNAFGGQGLVIAAANGLAVAFNTGLMSVQHGLNAGLQGIDIKLLDLYALLNEVLETPEAFSIGNTTDACVTPGVAPYQCEFPDAYLFWDGVHPTKAVHGIVARKAAELVLTE